MKPIRILCVFASLDFGGAETMVMNLYRTIDRSRIQFDFVKMTPQKCAYEDEIISLGGKIFLAPRFKYTNLRAFDTWWDNYFVDHPEYRIIHGHYYTISGLYFRVAKKHGLITIGHSHTAKRRTLKYKIASLLAEKYSDYCLACSVEAARFLFPHRKVGIVRNAIDVEKFIFDSSKRTSIRKQLGINDSIVIGHTGRFNTPKNHSFLIDVFKMIHDRCPETKLLLVGDGSLRSEVESKVIHEGLSSSCIFVGATPRVSDYLSAMDCFFFPSKYEGLGIALVEAQANGLTCIASDRVPAEADVTGNCSFLPLTLDLWCESFFELHFARDDSAAKKVLSSGYDINLTSKQIAEFYLGLNDLFKVNLEDYFMLSP